jgi:predicted PurR-regulated permease PerM
MRQGSTIMTTAKRNSARIQDDKDATTTRSPASTGPERFDWAFLRRVLIVFGVAAIAYGIWRLSGVLLLIFAATLLAVLLSRIAELVSRYLFVPERWSLALSTTLLAALLIAFLILFGTQLAGQINRVFDQLPKAVDSLGTLFNVSNMSKELGKALGADLAGHVFVRTLGISYTVLGALGDLAVVLVSAVYLAADPTLYRRGVTKLFPPNQQARIIDAMSSVATALRHWFAGQLLSMLIVGCLSGLAYWLIGVPSALALGIIAGLTNFIPLLGPILGAVPAVLLAVTEDPVIALWTAVAVFAIQQVEGNVIMPLVQRRAVALPPAASLFALVIFGVMFEWLGILLAVPLAVAVMVLVQKLWVHDTLGK